MDGKVFVMLGHNNVTLLWSTDLGKIRTLEQFYLKELFQVAAFFFKLAVAMMFIISTYA